MPKVTMQVIADHLGLSRFAVSRALSGGAGVSEETRRRVLDTAQRLGYVAPGAHRRGDRFRTRNILFLIEQSRFKGDQYFWPRVLAGVEVTTKRYNLNLMFATISDEQEAGGILPASLLEGNVDGALAVGDFGPVFLKALREQKPPVILVDVDGTESSLDAVMTADGRGAFLAAKHLADLGHREIGFVGDLSFAGSFRRRYHGLLEAGRQLGLDTGNAPQVLDHADRHYWEVPEIRAALARVPRLPTAFLCANDNVALTLIRALAEVGRRVPEDVSVVGFDDIDLSRTNVPPLTTLHIHKKRMGERAVETLAWRLANPDRPPETVTIGTTLVTRGSTAPPRADSRSIPAPSSAAMPG